MDDESTIANSAGNTLKLPKPPKKKRKLWLLLLSLCILLLGLLILQFSKLRLPTRQTLGWVASSTATPIITLTQTPPISRTPTSTPTVTATSTQIATVTLTSTPAPTFTPTLAPTFTPAVPADILSLSNNQDIQVVFEIDYHGYIYDLWKNLAFSSGDTLVALSDQQGLRVWRTSDWKLISTLEAGEGYQPGAVIFSLDGSYLVSGGLIPDDPAPARIWYVAGSLLLVRLDFPALSFAISNDGQLIACQDDDRVKIVRVITGEVISELTIPGGKILAGPHFSPSGKFLAAGNGVWLEVWDISGCAENTEPCGSLVMEQKALPNRYENYLAFSQDDAWVIYRGQALPFVENKRSALLIPALKYWLQGEGSLLAYPQLERNRFAFLNLDSGITQFNVSGWDTDQCVQCPFSADGSLYVYTSQQNDSLSPSLMVVRSGKTVHSLDPNPALAGHFFSAGGRFLIIVNQVEPGNWDRYKIQIWGMRSN